MASKPRVVRKAVIVPSDTAAALERYVPDLADWPRTWHYEPDDIPVGKRIVAAFMPFLIDLLQQGLAAKTLRRHRDHLWMLGGEIIHRRYLEPELARLSIEATLRKLVHDDGGPLIAQHLNESEQQTFDSTCRKLHRFLYQHS